MNQANTICMCVIILFMAHLASILCFGLNPTHLGGWMPAMLMTCLPITTYMLGRGWIE